MILRLFFLLSLLVHNSAYSSLFICCSYIVLIHIVVLISTSLYSNHDNNWFPWQIFLCAALKGEIEAQTAGKARGTQVSLSLWMLHNQLKPYIIFQIVRYIEKCNKCIFVVIDIDGVSYNIELYHSNHAMHHAERPLLGYLVRKL